MDRAHQARGQRIRRGGGLGRRASGRRKEIGGSSRYRDRNIVARNEVGGSNRQAQKQNRGRDECLSIERAINLLDEGDTREADVGVVMLVIEAGVEAWVVRAVIREVNAGRCFASIEAHVQMLAAHRHCDDRKADNRHQHPRKESEPTHGPGVSPPAPTASTRTLSRP